MQHNTKQYGKKNFYFTQLDLVYTLKHRKMILSIRKGNSNNLKNT